MKLNKLKIAFIEKKLKKLKKNKNTFLKKVENDILKEYKYWYAILDIKQYYLGRIFLYAKRPTATNMISLNKNEREELWSILKKIKKIYKKTFNPDILNFAFLGNDVQHCHLHIIPRYKTQRIINGVKFKDENYGHNYSRPNASSFKINDYTHELIYQILKKHF